MTLNLSSGNLVDDAARILASPMPRRQAVKALSRVLAGSLFAAFGVVRADAQSFKCGNSTCAAGQTCCTGPNGTFCSVVGGACCGTTSCGATQICCTGTYGQNFCATGATCCANFSCSAGQSCCTTPGGGQQFCSSTGQSCCGYTSCYTGTQQCCGGGTTAGSVPFCANSTATCCGNTSCGTNQACVAGRCQASQA